MNLLLSLSEIIALLLGFCGFAVGIAKYLFVQQDKKIAALNAEQEARREEAQKIWRTSFTEILNAQQRAVEERQRIELSIMKMQAELPMTYVMRDDYVRGQTVIEAKIDSLAKSIENLILRQGAMQ
ncbi:MAG: hypothetical protein LBS70_09845 [Candidatus Accumulibacter sp.]|jgi:hypothetical protein|nr:hypothetical protein [Accumulibacter sp.]